MSFNFTGTPTGHGTGGDSLTTDLNLQFDAANMVWMAVSAAGVMFMVPGIGLLYSGLSRKKHSLSSLWLSLTGLCVCLFQWFFWGYSLAFSHETKGNGFIGTLEFFGFRNVLGAPSVAGTVPDILYAVFQGFFGAVCGVLTLGGSAERARLFPTMVFLFVWMTVVYCPVACWSWNSSGWLAKLGALDFAGSLIHESAGHGALMYALILGRRDKNKNPDRKIPKYKPHSVTSVVLGTVFLFFGWIFFDGGSANAATIRAWYAIETTILAAASGGLTWMIIDYFRYDGKWTTVGLCSGIVGALVGITPGSGFVPVWASFIIGVVTATACNFAIDVQYMLGIDDGLAVWALHGVGACVGSVFTGIFAADYVNATGGQYSTPIDGGWINHHWKQVGYQLAAITAIGAWTCVVTAIILLTMNQIPWLKIRLSPEEEEQGTDITQIGEMTYQDEEDYTFVPQPVRSKISVVKSNQNGSADDKIEQSLRIDDAFSNSDDSNSNKENEKSAA